MSIPIYQVDSFTDVPFRGNPAAVCFLERPVDDDWLQNVAGEMNLSETAFVWRRPDGFQLRWFTPAAEVELCGHATLAAAHVVWQRQLVPPDQPIRFHTLSGILTAHALTGEPSQAIMLDFPATPPEPAIAPEGLLSALQVSARSVNRTRFDFVLELDSEAAVVQCRPEFAALARVPDVRGIIITARADRPEVDFVSRFFGPAVGVDEDPVTGSAHFALAPFWGKQLERQEMTGYQASRRGGLVRVRWREDRVQLIGSAVTVMQGEFVG